MALLHTLSSLAGGAIAADFNRRSLLRIEAIGIADLGPCIAILGGSPLRRERQLECAGEVKGGSNGKRKHSRG
jgi:hypothetical protein